MYITLRGILIFTISWLFLWGVWQFLWVEISYRGWKLEHQKNESFFEFCQRYYGGIIWKIRGAFGIKWFYNSRAFRNYIRLRGVLLFCLAVGVLIVLFRIQSSEYNIYLDVRL